MTDNRTTELLRKMLDERGVEWKSGNFIEPNAETQWGNNRYSDYPELPPFLTISNCTPEQAIAATLRGGMCHITASSTDGLCSDNPRQYFELSCGHTFTLDGLEPPNYCPNCGAKVIQGVDNAD